MKAGCELKVPDVGAYSQIDGWISFDGQGGVELTGFKDANALATTTRLLANAKPLYAALRSSVIEHCHSCPSCEPHPNYICKCKDGECFIQEWRKLLNLIANAE